MDAFGPYSHPADPPEERDPPFGASRTSYLPPALSKPSRHPRTDPAQEALRAVRRCSRGGRICFTRNMSELGAWVVWHRPRPVAEVSAHEVVLEGGSDGGDEEFKLPIRGVFELVTVPDGLSDVVGESFDGDVVHEVVTSAVVLF